MAISATMKALLLKGEGYSREAPVGRLDSFEPWLDHATIAVPQPGPSQVLIKVRMASINPSDVVFIQGLYGQPRLRGRPAGFEGVGDVFGNGGEAGEEPAVFEKQR